MRSRRSAPSSRVLARCPSGVTEVGRQPVGKRGRMTQCYAVAPTISFRSDAELFGTDPIGAPTRGTGTRQRNHNHYLKGLVWCGRCKYRLIVQRAVGRGGGVYFYFYCRGRQQGLCDLPSVPVEIMESAVAAYYGDAVNVPAEWIAEVRAEVDQAVDANHALSETLRAQHTKRLDELDRKEDYLLDLAADQGWPKDKLRAKIDAIRSTRTDIEDTLARSAQQLDRGRDVFHAALALLAEPQQAYERGNEAVRTILNQAFFTKLYIDAGKVIDHDAQEPFDALGESYHVYRLNRTSRSTPRSPACTHGAKGHKAGSPNPISADQGWSKPAMVGDTGIEPVTSPV